MKTNPLKDGVLTHNSVGVGTITPQMTHERAVELAKIDGRSRQEVSKSDREEAVRELTGGPDQEPNEVLLESAPESERWDPLPGSTGEKVSVPPGEDEDAEGRSDKERLVEEGSADAELDRMRQASKTGL